MNHQLCRMIATIVLGLGLARSAHAQWQTQTIVVSNGWTAMYLYVNASTENLLPATAGLPITPDNPIDEIWLWKAPASTAQYLTTPESPFSAGGYWAAWNRTNSQNSLVTLIPNAAYLVHSTATTNYTWKIKGQPVPPFYTWDMTGLNFVGFPTPPVNPPNFQTYFSQAPAIADAAQIFEYVGGPLSTNPPNPVLVAQPQYTTVTRGQAFWLSATNVNNTYFGPFNVNLPNPSGLNYGASGGQLTFHLVNQSETNLTITMTVLPSETPPTGQTNIVGVPPLLLEGAENLANLTYAYTVLSTNNSGGATNSVSWILPPSGQSGSDVAVTLGVNRFAMTAPAGSLFAGILQFTDSLGLSDVNIPVAATAANNTGLWVGNASVSQVSYDLKSYATNTDGSFVVSAVTNLVVMTNRLALGTTTNLAVLQAFATNNTVSYYSVTRAVEDVYTPLLVTNQSQYVVTNSLVTYSSTTNWILETIITGYTLDSGDTGLIFQTTTTTNGPYIVTSAVSTNFSLATNYSAVVPASPTNLAENATAISLYNTISYTVTNGPDSDPVTNVVTGSYSLTNFVPETIRVVNATLTNALTAAATTVYLPPGDTFYTLTNTTVTVYPAVTNFYPTSEPLFQSTNAGEIIYANIQTNTTLATTVTSPVSVSDVYVTVMNYTVLGTQTNFVSISTNTLAAQTSYQLSQTTFSSVSNLTVNFASRPEFVVATNLLVSSVSNYVVTAHNTSLDAVSAPFPIRLIIFNSASSACLLQRVYYGLNTANNLVVSTTQNSLDPAQLATARRISSAVLPWAATNTPYYFSGGALAQGATLATTFTEAYDDQAANPFLHTYHPDHNNLDLTQSPPRELARGSQSYDITHLITLGVTPNATDFISLTTANRQLSGTYSETITLTGLGGATRSYQTAGSFSLVQVSPVPVLSTQ